MCAPGGEVAVHVLILLEVRHAGSHLRHYVDQRRQRNERALALRVRVQRSLLATERTPMAMASESEREKRGACALRR